MPQKIVDIPGVGEVLLAKRRGSKNLRLSIRPDGQVRVGLPAWAPYSAGIKFALGRAGWISKNRPQRQTYLLKHGDLIGKSYRLVFEYDTQAKRVSTRLKSNTVFISSHLPIDAEVVQARIIQACERALRQDSAKLLAARLEQLSRQYNLPYSSLKIKRLRSRWGSCSNQQTITLSYYLIQLPWQLIDYVIVHELTHTRHLHHGPDFWTAMEIYLPGARMLRKQVNIYRPVILPNGQIVS
jgi:predicted metal-dependent hydrolase